MQNAPTTSLIASSNCVTPFLFDSHHVRVLVHGGEPWFVAADICEALGLSNVTQAISRLDDDEQALISNEGISRGNDMVNVVSESGMYSLVLSSRKPEAKRFKKWVTAEVLPAIRKTGAYGTPAVPNFNDPAAAAEAWAKQYRLTQAANDQLMLQAEQLAAQAPKVALADALVEDEQVQGLAVVAKLLNHKQRLFFEHLAQLGWIYKRVQHDSLLKDNPWLPSAWAVAKGYLTLQLRPDHAGVLRKQTMVTSAGIAAIHTALATKQAA